MNGRGIPVGEATAVEVSAGGDLTVGGWGERAIQAEGDEWTNLTPDDSPGAPIRLRFDGDGRLRVPAGVTLRISEVGGDARVRDLSGAVEAVEVSGDLRIEEIRGPVQIETVRGDAKVQRISGPVNIHSATSDVDVRQVSGPLICERAGGDVTVEQISGPVSVTDRVGGDLAMAGISGPTTVREVGGDVNLIECQSVTVDSIGGDLTAKDLRGSLQVSRVEGDAQIAGCDGLAALEEVGGDFTARGLGAGLRAPRVGGRIRLNTGFAPGQSYDLASEGATTVLIDGDPAGVSATFELRRIDGGRIAVGLALEDSIVEPGFVRGRLGSGEATVRITSSGGLRLEAAGAGAAGFDDLLEGIFDEIGEGFRGAFGAFSGFGWGGSHRDPEDRGHRRDRRAEEKVQEAAQRMAEEAERQARRATERAQRHVERATRQAERHAGNWRFFGKPVDVGPGWINPMAPPRPTPPRAPSPPPRPPATEEERLAILNILAAGTIGAEDAARLLEALG